MAARETLHNLRQDRDEPIGTYGSRLKGQASVCKFTDTCDASVDFMIRDVLCRG